MTQRPLYYRWRNGQPEAITDSRPMNGWRHDSSEPVSPGAEVPTWRHVAYTEWPDGVHVSTIFLGLDVGYGDVPVLFETCVFYEGSPAHGFVEHYATLDEARAGHQTVVACVEVVRGHQLAPDTTLSHLLDVIADYGRRSA